jgi:hypothetical protein
MERPPPVVVEGRRQGRHVEDKPGKGRSTRLVMVAAALVGVGLSVSMILLEPGVARTSASAPSEVGVSSGAAAPRVSTPEAAPADPKPTIGSAEPVGVDSRPLGLTFPAASIDTAIVPLTPSSADLTARSLVPPLTLEAYWLTSYGVPGPGSDNTTYIAGHSWEGRDAPFNRLSGGDLMGTEFVVTTEAGDITYIVDSVTTYEKDTLKDSEIWDIVPGRVVLISCYTEDPWGKNIVVTAMPISA